MRYSETRSLPWVALAISASALATIALLSGQASASTPGGGDVQALHVRVLRRLPHDPRAFTQGLLWYEGNLYESTGLYGESTLRRIDPMTGAVETKIDLPAELFGEGLARLGDRLVQLTWKEGVARRYRLSDFALLGQWKYAGEGWGLCTDRGRLVMSDGSARLFWRDPDDFSVRRQVTVTMNGSPVRELNELECAEGWIYANQLNSDWIYRIDPSSGRVVARIDAGGLDAADERQPERVLNGIAYDDTSHHFYLTGKKWSLMFEVIFVGG